MIKKILRRIKIELSRRVGPVMIDGFSNADGSKMKKTRYGSTTYFQGMDKIRMGENVYIAHHCFIDGSNDLYIGEGCQVCSFASILTHSSHISIRLYGKQYGGGDMVGYKRGATSIGKYTFVGPYSTLMPGTKIGKGSIVAAYAYVEGEYPDYAIIAGNPAKIVGDTRKLDAPFLEKHPELKAHYDTWSRD